MYVSDAAHGSLLLADTANGTWPSRRAFLRFADVVEESTIVSRVRVVMNVSVTAMDDFSRFSASQKGEGCLRRFCNGCSPLSAAVGRWLT
jgi:hypothetical protein